MSSLKGVTQPVNHVSKKMNKLFDWDNRLKSAGLKKVITTAKFKLIDGYHSTGLPTDKQSLLNGIQVGADVYALISSIIELSAVANTKEFDKHDPLNAAAMNIFRIQIVTHLLNTAEAVINIRKTAGIYAATVTFPPLQRLLTNIKLPEIQTKLGKVGIKGLGYTVAILGVALPIVEASSEFYNSNYITGSAKITEAAGTLAFSIGLAGLGAVTTGNAAVTAIAAFAWELIIIGLILISVGMAIYYYFKTDPFEKLLKQCFWGNGDKYFAGGDEKDNNVDVARNSDKSIQLDSHIKFFNDYALYYQMEMQEFANLFFTSQLQITAVPKSTAGLGQSYYGGAHYIIQYQFKLGNFQCGISDVEYQLVEKKALFTYPSSTTGEHRPDNAEVVVKHGGMDYVLSRKTPFNDAFVLALGNALNKALNSPMLLDGELVLNFDVEAGVFAGNSLGQSIPSVYWYYVIDRIKGDIAPLRFRDNNPNDKIYGCLDGEGTE
ncbi:hypothetical protein M2263_002748 [Providencia alcalifaciens]|nr:hypothetical protein [Providencia alcalifaciens]